MTLHTVHTPVRTDVSDVDTPFGQNDVADLAKEVRSGVAEHLHLHYDELKLLSTQEATSQEQYIERVISEGNQRALEQLWNEYASEHAKSERGKGRLLYYQNFREPLEDLRQRKVISQESYKEWIEWMEDNQRSMYEKTSSGKEEFKKYLKEREELDAKRMKLLKDDRVGKVQDNDLKKQIAEVEKDDVWLKQLSYTERCDLIDNIKAGLALEGESKEMKSLKYDAEKMLKDATKKPQPALHRDKVGTWLKRIFDDGIKKLKEQGLSSEKILEKIKNDFLEGSSPTDSLSGLIKVWRAVAVQFRKTRADPAFEGIKTGFVNTKGFLWMHYKERVQYVQRMKAQRDRAKQLRSRAWSLITSASQVLDSTGRKRWLNDYVFNDHHTLEELESIINGNLAIRLDAKLRVYHLYEKAKKRSRKFQGIRGMQTPEKGEFLKLHYKKQCARVQEMEHRIEELEGSRPDFLFIRYCMDRRDFEGAMELIHKGKKKDISSEDKKQLDFMERYVLQYSDEHEVKVGVIAEKSETAGNIDSLIASLPSDLQDILISLAEMGSEHVNMFGWGVYNREWCNLHGYLDPEREHMAIETGKEVALQKLRDEQDGVMSETIQGKTGEEEFIKLSRSSATNVCLDISDSGAKSAMKQTVERTKGDHQAWYWTNIILHRGGNLISRGKQKEDNEKIYKIGKAVALLEQRGQRYVHRGTQIALKEKEKMIGGNMVETQYATVL